MNREEFHEKVQEMCKFLGLDEELVKTAADAFMDGDEDAAVHIIGEAVTKRMIADGMPPFIAEKARAAFERDVKKNGGIRGFVEKRGGGDDAHEHGEGCNHEGSHDERLQDILDGHESWLEITDEAPIRHMQEVVRPLTQKMERLAAELRGLAGRMQAINAEGEATSALYRIEMDNLTDRVREIARKAGHEITDNDNGFVFNKASGRLFYLGPKKGEKKQVQPPRTGRVKRLDTTPAGEAGIPGIDMTRLWGEPRKEAQAHEDEGTDYRPGNYI